MYLTDWGNFRVTCFQLDGKMVYQYEDREELKRPNGIYVDSVGNSLVQGVPEKIELIFNSLLL